MDNSMDNSGRTATEQQITAGNSSAPQRGRPFKKGRSGNPNGRPVIPQEVKEMLRAATPKAARLLIDTIEDDKAKLETRLDCAKTVLDRVYGKASQPIDGEIDHTVLIQLSEDIQEYAK